MLEKGFLSENSRRKTAKNRNASLVGKLMMFVGAVIVIVGLMYILMNLQRADGVARIWLPFLIGGIVLIVIGMLVVRIRSSRKI